LKRLEIYKSLFLQKIKLLRK
jgi:hypothetical protein